MHPRNWAVAAWLAVTLAAICLYGFVYDGVLNTIVFSGFMLLALPTGGHPFAALIMLWLIIPLWALVASLRQLLREDFRPHWAWIAPAMAAVVIAIAGTGHLFDLGDAIRFQIERTGYEAKIAALRSGRLSIDDDTIAGPPMLAVFRWGGFLSKWEGVVYDERGYFDDTNIIPAPAWATSSLGEEILACPSSIRSMGGHFYVAHFSC